jgi:hypothetical protein
LEHHANIVPWQQLASEKGARLKAAPIDDSGQILLDAYSKLFRPQDKTGLIHAGIERPRDRHSVKRSACWNMSNSRYFMPPAC